MVESSDIMTREFVMLPEFDKRWKELGLTDDDFKVATGRTNCNHQKAMSFKEQAGFAKCVLHLRTGVKK